MGTAGNNLTLQAAITLEMCGSAHTPGGIAGYFNGDASLANCHNMGDITGSDRSGEIYGDKYANVSLTYCTYLKKTSNANSNGATESTSMTSTMLLNDCITQMNNYVRSNAMLKLKEWEASDGRLVFKKNEQQ